MLCDDIPSARGAGCPRCGRPCPDDLVGLLVVFRVGGRLPAEQVREAEVAFDLVGRMFDGVAEAGGRLRAA